MKTDIRPGDKTLDQYDGVDLYGARCALLHTSSAQIGKRPRHVGYHDSNFHAYNPANHPDFVVLGIELLKDDLWTAVARFIPEGSVHSGPLAEAVRREGCTDPFRRWAGRADRSESRSRVAHLLSPRPREARRIAQGRVNACGLHDRRASCPEQPGRTGHRNCSPPLGPVTSCSNPQSRAGAFAAFARRPHVLLTERRLQSLI
jgi:hypothetical protein